MSDRTRHADPTSAAATSTTSRLHLPARHLSRRRFLALAGGLVAVGCSSDGGIVSPLGSTTTRPSTDAPTNTAGGSGGPVPTTAPGTVTSVTVPDEATDGRVLVVVRLDGGNDAANTLVPDLGSYRDLRPGIALPDDVLLEHAALPGHAFHPSLAPLVPLLDSDELAVVAGVGFADPDRSHFTSIDRWDRADLMDETIGWLGRWLDTLDADLPSLGALALGDAGLVMAGRSRQPTVIQDVDAFAYPSGVSNADIRALADGTTGDPLRDAARSAFLASVGAVEEFDEIADAVRDAESADADGEFAPPSGPFANGLAVAAELIRSDVGTTVVSVSGSGFDTHAGQLDLHAALLDDLATGIAEFWSTLRRSGDADRVLLMTTSEFGRRAFENGSAGTDHGAGGCSFLVGDPVTGGLHGTIDTDDIVDGDLRPTFDPREMFTACLDWLGADAERVLGARHDHTFLA